MQHRHGAEIVDRAARPLRVVRNDARGFGRERAEVNLAQGQNPGRRVSEERHVELAPVDVLLDQRRLTQGGSDGVHGQGKLARAADDAGVRDANRAVLANRLHDEREGQVAGVVWTNEDAARRGWNAGGREPLLHPILAKREAEHLGWRSRERNAE